MSADGTALTIRAGASDRFMPALTIEHMIARRNMLITFSKNAELMIPKVDFGIIPGTQKPSLLKPGAEKLCQIFGLLPIMTMVRCVEDWEGKDHKEPFFYYVYKCELWCDGVVMVSTEASCNSWETKYRYRKGERCCPKCGVQAIMKSKQAQGGWYCFDKKGGCGANFHGGTELAIQIDQQDTTRTTHPDPAELVNTLQKMAQKRCHVGSTLVGVGASEFYTQDLEDVNIIEAEFVPTTEPAQEAEPLPTIEEALHILKDVAAGYEYTGKLSAIRPLLVSDVPAAKWTAETYMQAARRPVEHWQLAIASLTPPPVTVAPPAPATAPEPAPQTPQPLSDAERLMRSVDAIASKHGYEEPPAAPHRTNNAVIDAAAVFQSDEPDPVAPPAPEEEDPFADENDGPTVLTLQDNATAPIMPQSISSATMRAIIGQ